MRELLIENLRSLIALKPDEMDWDDFISDPPCFEPNSHCTMDAAFGYGYLRGIADAVDMTCIEVLDQNNISEKDFQ